MAKKKYGIGGPKASDYVGNPMGYFNDKAEFKMQEGGEFEPYLSENKTVYHTGPNSGIMSIDGFRNEKQAERVVKRRAKKKKKLDKRAERRGDGIGTQTIIR
jgi:hypothetical protein